MGIGVEEARLVLVQEARVRPLDPQLTRIGIKVRIEELLNCRGSVRIACEHTFPWDANNQAPSFHRD